MCTGFLTAPVVPSPKSQSQLVIVEPAAVLKSVNCTVKGTQPDSGVAEKFTTGIGKILMYCVLVKESLLPNPSSTTSLMVYCPGVK